MCGEGKKQQYEFLEPEYKKAMNEKIAAMIQAGLGGTGMGGTASYKGPIAVSQNPLNLAAANMMMNYMGYGNYKTPSYLTYDQMMKGYPTPDPKTNISSQQTNASLFPQTTASGGMNPLMMMQMAGYDPFKAQGYK